MELTAVQAVVDPQRADAAAGDTALTFYHGGIDRLERALALTAPLLPADVSSLRFLVHGLSL